MSVVSALRSAFSRLRWRKATDTRPQAGAEAFLVFANTGEVIQAQAILRERGMPVRVMAPPPALRTGCDMVIVTSLLHSFRAVNILEEHRLAPLRMTPVGESLLEPVSLFQIKDYGEWLMVRAANMKVTVEKASGRIVNVSGGGCPDVPYLATRLVGSHIDDPGAAREHGQTLCGFALHLALEEMRKQRTSVL
jgi:hypothetical protein